MTKQELFLRRVSIYTTLMVLKKMRDQVGMDSMNCFLESYMRMMDGMEPNVKKEVYQDLEKKGFAELYF